jgi:hypothetical protein
MTGSIRNKILVVFYLSSVLSLLGYILIYLLSQQQGELVEDSSQIPPVTEAWFRLNNGMHHAVSSQREWLLSGNSIFREGRMNAWDKEIEPALLELGPPLQNITSLAGRTPSRSPNLLRYSAC